MGELGRLIWPMLNTEREPPIDRIERLKPGPPRLSADPRLVAQPLDLCSPAKPTTLAIDSFERTVSGTPIPDAPLTPGI